MHAKLLKRSVKQSKSLSARTPPDQPKVSDDNPYSEANFKTLKYDPIFPDRFGSLTHARELMDWFQNRYNHEHHHQGLGLHTPADVHYGLATAKATGRTDVLSAARAAHPERFGTNNTPKILALPDAAWINKPTENKQTEDQATYEPAA